MTIIPSTLKVSGILCPALKSFGSTAGVNMKFVLHVSPSVVAVNPEEGTSSASEQVWCHFFLVTNGSQDNTTTSSGWFQYVLDLVKPPVMAVWTAIKSVVVTVTTLSTFFGGAALFAAKNTQEVLLPLQPLFARAVRVLTAQGIRCLGSTVAFYASENAAYLVYCNWFRTLWATYFMLFTAAFFLWVAVYWAAVGVQALLKILFA